MYGLISRLVETQTNRFINMFVNTNVLRVSVLGSYQQVLKIVDNSVVWYECVVCLYCQFGQVYACCFSVECVSKL